jgi:tetratricopeptide (TPR) repeat protein
MTFKRTLLSLLLGSLAFTTLLAPSALAATPFDTGMEDLRLTRYHAAEIDFENAVAKNRSDARSLIMLGRTRELLKDPDGAKEAYTAAFNLNPFNSDGLQAKQALLDLASDLAAKKSAPLDDASTTRKTADTIQRQGRQLAQRYTNNGDALAQARLNLTFDSYRADRIRNGKLGLGMGFYRFGLGNYGDLSSWDRIRNSYRQYDDQAQALNYRTAAAKTAALAQSSAGDLLSLLGETGHATNPHLRALGTNLYVRNYESAQADELPPEDPPLPLHAKALKLSDLPVELQAKAKKL